MKHDTQPSVPTCLLFDQTRAALCTAQWGAARALLDALSRRTDNAERLASAAHYAAAARAPLHPEYAQLIQDRIDLVNSRVADQRAEDRTPNFFP